MAVLLNGGGKCKSFLYYVLCFPFPFPFPVLTKAIPYNFDEKLVYTGQQIMPA